MEAQIRFQLRLEVAVDAFKAQQGVTEGADSPCNIFRADDLAYGEALQRRTHPEELTHLPGRDGIDSQHAPIARRDQAFLLQVAQRLTNCASTDTEVRRQIDFAEVVPRPIAARCDRRPDCLQGSLTKRGAIQTGKGFDTH